MVGVLMGAGFYRDIEPEDLPVPDKQIMQLIQYVLQEDARIETLTSLIRVNPALTTQLLGLVNSAFFGFRRKIDTISDAIVAMGMESLRNLVLCFAVKEVLAKKTIPGFDIDDFWEDSIRRGVAARQIGLLVKGPVEQGFTAGMLQDIGLLVLFSMEPEKADRWPLLRSNLPDQRREMEAELFHATHDDMGALLAKKWNLPLSYVYAIGNHHRMLHKKERGRPEQVSEDFILAGMTHLADFCNAVYTCHDTAGAVSVLKNNAGIIFNLAEDDIETLLALLPGQVEEISTSLNVCVGSHIDFATIMEKANHRLVEDNISYQELTWRLQKSLKQRDEYAARLEVELDTARQVQKSLQPDIEKIHQICAFNIPAFQLSGDFYDYFLRPDNSICFCLGDVSGKGTAAALLMTKAVSLFRCLGKVENDISKIVQLMNTELVETSIRGMFVTFVGGVLDPGTGQISIINVGHPPPFLVTGKTITKIEATDPPLGILPTAIHPAGRFSIKGSRLYLYSDGFTEGRLKQREKKDPGTRLGLRGFLRWLIQSGHLPPGEQMAWIQKQCTTQLAPQSDDLTFMTLSGD